MKPVLATLSLLVCAAVASADITVTGQGKVTYKPDVGYINAGISSEGKSAAEAWEKAAKYSSPRASTSFPPARRVATRMRRRTVEVSFAYRSSRRATSSVERSISVSRNVT